MKVNGLGRKMFHVQVVGVSTAVPHVTDKYFVVLEPGLLRETEGTKVDSFGLLLT